MAKSKRIPVALDDKAHEAIREEAKQRGVSMSALIREAAIQWLESYGFYSGFSSRINSAVSHKSFNADGPGWVIVTKKGTHYRFVMTVSPDVSMTFRPDEELVHSIETDNMKMLGWWLKREFRRKETGNGWFRLDELNVEYIKSLDRILYGS